MIHTFNSWAWTALLSNSKDNTSDITEFPPAFGTSRIFCAELEIIIFLKFLFGMNSEWSIPDDELSSNNFQKRKMSWKRTLKFSPIYIFHGSNSYWQFISCPAVWFNTVPCADIDRQTLSLFLLRPAFRGDPVVRRVREKTMSRGTSHHFGRPSVMFTVSWCVVCHFWWLGYLEVWFFLL